MIYLIVGFVGVFGLFGLWFANKRSKAPKKLTLKHKAIFLIGTALSVGLIIAGSLKLSSDDQRNTSSSSPTSTIPVSKKTVIDSRSPLQYSVHGQKKTGESLRVTVITPETEDARLVAINDKVFPDYKDKASNVFIDYFDDAEIAKIYFDKVANPKTNDKDKKNLVSHYIALMMSSKISGNKMYKISTDNIVLKTYE